ncbi:MAG: hypothetical protein CL763_02330 [Chloroflexi bacterium]|nr:hypothetical protein [Chloroflexota bacterium]
MSKLLISLFPLMIFFLMLSPATIYASTNSALSDDLQSRATELHKSIMCPKCSGQTLHQSNSPIASSMRTVIHLELLNGKSDDQIIALLVNAYGKEVLASPPTDGFLALIWILPPIVLLIGLGTIGFVIIRLKRPIRRPIQTMHGRRTQDDFEASGTLAIVDQELGENYQISK